MLDEFVFSKEQQQFKDTPVNKRKKYKLFCNYFLLQLVAPIDYTVTLLETFKTASGFRSYSDRVSFILGGGRRCFGTCITFAVFFITIVNST